MFKTGRRKEGRTEGRKEIQWLGTVTYIETADSELTPQGKTNRVLLRHCVVAKGGSVDKYPKIVFWRHREGRGACPFLR